MTAKPVAHLLPDRGITRSRGHKSSNETAYSESRFRTFEYRHDLPELCPSFEDAHRLCRSFFGWYNDDHRQSGIG